MLNRNQKQQLVDLLLAAPCMQSVEDRRALTGELPPRIAHAVKTGNNARTHALNIVNACMDRADGLALLLEAVRFFDKGTTQFQALAAFVSDVSDQAESRSPDRPARMAHSILRAGKIRTFCFGNDLSGKRREFPKHGSAESPILTRSQYKRLLMAIILLILFVPPALWFGFDGPSFLARRQLAENQVGLAEGFMDVGRYEDAARMYEKLLEQEEHKRTARQGLAIIQALQPSAEGEYAPELIVQRLEAFGQNPYAFNLLGDMYNRSSEFDKAITHYESALRLRPQLAAAHFGLGLIRLRESDYAAARKAFQQAVEDAPHKAEYHLNLAYAYTHLDSLDQALQHYEKAMRLDPDQLAVYQEAALVHQRRGEAERALEYQTSLAALLVAENITRLAKNQLPWA
ncbi:MAG: tetratricopeptide repeat protein, partial [Gammaproteobacteria bacterium]|nr:tetratricopeptide repeat protein [Gammaproteobacteria bacterium]